MAELVSTIIPAFNAGRFIHKAIESALAQGVQQQIIIIDDGSTDDTACVARSFGSKIELIQQNNAGVSAARNRGIAEATGDYVAFLDADDTWLPGKLKSQLNLFEKQPDIGTVICDEMHVDPNGELVRPSFIRTRSFFNELPTIPSKLDKPLTWLTRESFFPTSSVITKKTVLYKAGTFDTNLSICEDRDLWIRLAIEAPIGLVPEVFVTYLTGRSDSLTSSVKQLTWANALRMVLMRYTSALEYHIKREHGNPDEILGNIFGEIGDIFWHTDNMNLAATAYWSSIKYRQWHFIAKWAAARSNTSSLFRTLKSFLPMN